MKTNLATYPKTGTHWEKNVWHERITKELQERRRWLRTTKGKCTNARLFEIKEILGQ